MSTPFPVADSSEEDDEIDSGPELDLNLSEGSDVGSEEDEDEAGSEDSDEEDEGLGKSRFALLANLAKKGSADPFATSTIQPVSAPIQPAFPSAPPAFLAVQPSFPAVQPSFPPIQPAFPAAQPLSLRPIQPAFPPVQPRLNIVTPAPAKLSLLPQPALTPLNILGAPVKLTLMPQPIVPVRPVQVPLPSPGTLKVPGLSSIQLPAVAAIPTITPLAVTPLVLNPVIPATAAPLAAPVVQVAATKVAAVDLETLINKLPGLNISGISRTPVEVPVDLNSLLQKEADETPEDFESRKVLTGKVAAIPGYQLNPVTSVTVAHIMMKKSKLGVKYEPDVENAISYLVSLL